MGAPKRKRPSMDSAIADMSSEDSFEVREIAEYTPRTQQEDSQSIQIASWGFDARDFGTAASQRPRRGASSMPAAAAAVPQRLPRKRSLEAVTEASIGTANEVNGNHEKRRQTPRRKQAPIALPTPPQLAEKTKSQALSQSSPRRSTRERKPTERSQEALIEQITPCRKKSRGSIVSVTSNRSEETPTIKPRKSRIVRLQVPSTAAHQESSQSISFSESFSHQQKSSDEQDSQASEDQGASFVDNRSFQDYSPEIFAQPQPEPILADSQDLYSSQLGPEDGGATSHAAKHLQEHLQASGCSMRERFSTSSWIARQGQQEPSTELRSEEAPQQHQTREHDPVLQDDAAVGDEQTQPTLPWCPPWNAPSPDISQAAAHVSLHASQATTIDETLIDFANPTPSLSKQELHDIADNLLACRTHGLPKPEPVGQPTVWADARMDLCETLHYFRSYQGACHSTGGFVRGFMFDKVAHARDYIDSNVVVARAGGGQVRDRDSGELKASGDQVEGTTSQNLRNCMSHYNPVVIITGVDNPHMPSQPPHQYCVLDYFKPTHIWVEKSGHSKIVRYRFEKLNASKDSWWRAKHTSDPVALGSLPPPFVKSCGTCARESPQIYLNGWMCLQPTCGSFWLIFPPGPDSSHTGPFEPDEASLIYDPRFLKSHTPWPNDEHEYPLTPSSALLSPHAVPGEDTSEAFIRGVVCPECGRCNSRLSWTGWECACGWTKSPPHALIPALSIREPLWPLSEAYTSSRDTHSPLVSVSVSFAHGYRINRYTLPGIPGFVTHMMANRSVVEEPGGPDAMFEALQQEDIGLRRRPIEGGMLKGGMYTRNFLVNYGMPYKFIAATESHPFPGPQHPVSMARSRLNWAARCCLSHAPTPSSTSPPPSSTPDEPRPDPAQLAHDFNEVLALAYFESQRISYHDDGESGLGPTIATLSLGSPGTMRVRLKAKHHQGVSAAGVYTDAAPVPGCIKYAERAALTHALATLRAHASPAQYRARLKQVPRELGLRAAGHARDSLVLKLAHGDVVVMHGAQLQRYYEHAVDHAGKLRFALTCRWIDPHSLPEAERPAYAVQSDGGGYDGARGGRVTEHACDGAVEHASDGRVEHAL